MRLLSSNDQAVPTFSGWSISQADGESLTKTVLTYLPPLLTPITEGNTIYKIFEIIQKRAIKMTIPYPNITFDIGAAMNAFKVLWNYPEKFSNIVIHLGDFHYMKEGFILMGKLIGGSGFEDVIFQAGICSSGSVNGVISGSHYNRSWAVHGLFSEALERLLFERFLTIVDDTDIPDVIRCNLLNRKATDNLLNDIEFNIEVARFFTLYENFKQDIRSRNYGKTAQFWVVYYLDIMANQHLPHMAVQENDFFLRLHGLKHLLPFCFALNKQNYARYGSFYVHSLENLDNTHPGCRELIQGKGLSVQAQDRYPARTTIDQRGEQTINRDAKTAGGIKFFASDQNAILKWTLNRSAQAGNTAALYRLVDVKNSDEEYKANRPSSILASERRVDRIIEVLSCEYVNPFDPVLENECLYNLRSGVAVDSELSDQILSIKESGEEFYKDFVDDRLKSTSIKIHDPIKRNKVSLFKSACKKVVVQYHNKQKTIEINRNILAKLLAYTAKTRRQIDFKVALTFPLCSLPLCFPILMALADLPRKVS